LDHDDDDGDDDDGDDGDGDDDEVGRYLLCSADRVLEQHRK
jgi:hypothetical protein